MKRIGVASTAILCLLLGITAPAYAQQEQHDQQEEQKARPARQDEKKTQSNKPAKQEEKSAQQRENTQQNKPSPQHSKNAQQQKPIPQNKNAQQGQTAQQRQQHTRQAEPGQQAQRADGSRGGSIPEDRFRANFGREHRFRVNQTDYSRDRRFQYGGYWFAFVDPWPANWLYTQDVFVVDIDGVYYLCNPMYPGVNIALSVTL